MNMQRTERIKSHALSLGFDLVAVAPVQPAQRGTQFFDWLAKGYEGDMGWLRKDPEKRVEPKRVLSQAKSMIIVGLSYYMKEPPTELWNDPTRGRIARYAWGQDYHDVLLPMLKELAIFVKKDIAQPLNARCYVDTGPVLERDHAARAGLGFIGKNSLLIHPQFGSYLFLGEILLDIELDYDEPAKPSGTCGNCQRCQDVCPTHAFPAPYILNSNLCISYLTIELKGTIPPQLRPLMKNWIYGCDECQSICPWVRQFSAPSQQRFLKYDPDWIAPKLIDLMQLDDNGFRERFRGTPILRTKRRGLLRNAAVALGNSGNLAALPVLEKATEDDEPLIREHALWAIEKIHTAQPR